MVDSDLEIFCALLDKTLRGIYGIQMDEDGYRIWWNLFRKVCSIDEFSLALSQHIADPVNGKYPPRPANIMEKLYASADAAWQKVRYAVTHYGGLRSVVFDDPKIHQAIQTLGGWVHICASMSESDDNMRNAFVAAYRAALPGTDVPPVLLGMVDIRNRSREVRPCLIGNLEKIRASLAGLEVDRHGKLRCAADRVASGAKA